MFFFNQIMLFVVSVFIIVTYSLNIGAMSEANILVKPEEPVQVELILSSIVLAVAALALTGIFIELPIISTLLTRQAFIYIFSFLLIITYSLNLALIDSGKATGLKNTEVGLSAVILVVSLLIFMYMTREVVHHYRAGGTFKDLTVRSKPLFSFHNPLFSSDSSEGGPATGAATSPPSNPLDSLLQMEK
jgi:hypothetical protein